MLFNLFFKYEGYQFVVNTNHIIRVKLFIIFKILRRFNEINFCRASFLSEARQKVSAKLSPNKSLLILGMYKYFRNFPVKMSVC